MPGIDFGVGEAALAAGAASAGTAAASTAATGAAAAGAAGAAASSSFLAYAGLASSAVSAVVGALGASQSAKAQSEASNYNAQIASENQQVATQNATLATQAGEQQAAMSGQKTRAEVGAIKANEAAANIDVNSGSAVDVRSSAAQLGELDAINIRSNAAREAYGYQTQATGFGAQSQLDQFTAQNASAAGDVSAAATFLSGAGSAGLNWARYQMQANPMNAGS